MTITLNQILELGAEIQPEMNTMYGEVYHLMNSEYNFFFRVKNNEITSSWKAKRLTEKQVDYALVNSMF